MSMLDTALKRPFHLKRPFQLFASLCLALTLLASCGGGGSDSNAPAGSSYTAGPITGFGSIIVNGVRFDVSRARVVDDSGRERTEADLKLGMMAQVQAGDITGVDTSQATQVQIGSAIIGPVDAINTSTRLLIVLGQTIDVADTTVFGPSLPSGPFSISVGTILEIFGMLDTTTGHYQATRIEAMTDATSFKLQGVVANLDTARRTFMMGGETISFASLPAGSVPPLSNGQQVTVLLQMQPNLNNQWVAAQFVTDGNPTPVPAAQSKVKLRGFITSVDSPGHFSINGLPVDASNATIRPKSATLVPGAQVKVEGSISNGTVIATKVTVKKGRGHGPGNDENEDEDDQFELHGAVENLNTSSQTCLVRGVPVNFSTAVFSGGGRDQLARGSRINVKGKLSSDGTRVEAANISFED